MAALGCPRCPTHVDASSLKEGPLLPTGAQGPTAERDGGRPGEPPAQEDLGKKVKKKKKKKYNRHPKPPYTYLAMIALVIQASPERKLKLSQVRRKGSRPHRPRK